MLVDENMRQFIYWVNESFGTVGMVVVALLSVAVVFGFFLLLQNLPLSESESLCVVCTYKNANDNAMVYSCPVYKRCRTIQFRAKQCPVTTQSECEGDT